MPATLAAAGNALHPTQKAVEVMRPLIEAFSASEQVVLDPFLGSRATGVAALETGRHFIGIERDADHFVTAVMRCAAAPRVNRGTGPVSVFSSFDASY